MKIRILNIVLTLVFTISITGITVAKTGCQISDGTMENCCAEGNDKDCCVEKISYLKNESNQERYESNNIIPELLALSHTYINFVNDLFSSTEKSHTRLYSKPSLPRDIPILVSCFRL